MNVQTDPAAIALSEESLGTRLQDILEPAALELRRPLAIDDRNMRLIAHTEHPTDIDRMRMFSVLHRPIPPKVIEWVHSHNIRQAEAPVSLPPNPEFEMDARVCVPIRCHDHLLGYLWLIDRDESISVGELDRAVAVAEAAGVVLYRDLMLQDLQHSREREFLRDLLSEDDAVLRHALEHLVEDELIVAGPAVAAVILAPRSQRDMAPESLRLAIDEALRGVRRQLAPKHALHLLRPDHAIFVASLAEPILRVHGAEFLTNALHAELRGTLDLAADDRQVVAVGGSAADVGDVRASYREALHAANVAKAVPSFGESVGWDDLGVYRVLGDFPLDGLGPNAIHPGLRRLIEDSSRHELVCTLECYLDRAGDMHATAETLYLHRATLWRRLRRIEQLAGIDLRDGEERLAIHLGLKVARLQGLTWTAPTSENGAQQ